ncbi:hypothetical protein SAMN04488691_101160 [Haloferax larsenii]|uniref:Uncharacterized protein n=1 Tax=Haloferax larsenii TaxID=302484 RepID=A0A1H7FY57_HALLR|nr:hypothetical protein SAMN04488691_101160 [Haloferax larsenii]
MNMYIIDHYIIQNRMTAANFENHSEFIIDGFDKYST